MNVTFENTTLIGGDYEENFINLTTLMPTTTSQEEENQAGLLVGTAIIVCIGLAGACFMMIPFIAECLKDYNVNESRSCRKSCNCLFCCSSNHQLSDIERNNPYPYPDTYDIILDKIQPSVQLVEIVVADPFDATEICSICLVELGEGDDLGALPCGHKHFHKKCIDKWLKISATCPNCRKSITDQ